MALRLQTVPARRGLWWLRQGLAETFRHPMAYAGLFAAFMLGVLLASSLPMVGGVLMLMMVPLLSLGFMMATAGAVRGLPVHAGVFVAPWRGPRETRQRLLVLCLAYAAVTVAVLWLCEQIDGGHFDELMDLAGQGRIGSPEWVTLAQTPGVREGMLARALLSSLVSVPFWFAPALVQWGGQGVGQALFSSTLALWQARGAFLLYGIAWAVAGAGVGLLCLSLLLAGLGGVVGLLAMALLLLLTVVFYTSLYASFVDCFAPADSV